MLNLDVRDLNFWLEKVGKKRAREQIERLQEIRIAMHATDDSFREIIEQLGSISGMTKEVGQKAIQDNWEDIKTMKRG